MKLTEAPLHFCRGFTLTELVVTTGLLAVLIQIGVPSLTKLLASLAARCSHKGHHQPSGPRKIRSHPLVAKGGDVQQ